jgi:hypothetical protein
MRALQRALSATHFTFVRPLRASSVLLVGVLLRRACTLRRRHPAIGRGFWLGAGPHPAQQPEGKLKYSLFPYACVWAMGRTAQPVATARNAALLLRPTWLGASTPTHLRGWAWCRARQILPLLGSAARLWREERGWGSFLGGRNAAAHTRANDLNDLCFLGLADDWLPMGF